jgi:hypothetical protein
MEPHFMKDEALNDMLDVLKDISSYPSVQEITIMMKITEKAIALYPCAYCGKDISDGVLSNGEMFCNDEHKFLNALKKSSALDNKEKV